jgi:hypothetical protein
MKTKTPATTAAPAVRLHDLRQRLVVLDQDISELEHRTKTMEVEHRAAAADAVLSGTDPVVPVALESARSRLASLRMARTELGSREAQLTKEVSKDEAGRLKAYMEQEGAKLAKWRKSTIDATITFFQALVDAEHHPKLATQIRRTELPSILNVAFDNELKQTSDRIRAFAQTCGKEWYNRNGNAVYMWLEGHRVGTWNFERVLNGQPLIDPPLHNSADPTWTKPEEVPTEPEQEQEEEPELPQRRPAFISYPSRVITD